MDFTLGLGELAGLMGALCAMLGVLSGLIMFSIRMIVRSEIGTLKDTLNEKFQTKEACAAIRRDCEKHRHEMAVRERELHHHPHPP